jgi:hypothetical protein
MMEIMAIQMCAVKRSGARSYTMLSRRYRLIQANSRSTNPADPVWKEAPVARATGRDRDMDVVLKRCRGEGCALEAVLSWLVPDGPFGRPGRRW